MKLFYVIIGLIFFNLSYCQDTIYLKNKEFIRAKVIEISPEKVLYKKYDNLSGPNYHIRKDEILEIKFENGTQENFLADNNSNRSLDETKTFIMKIINDHGWEKDSNTRRLKASFEGDRLRIVVMNKKYTKPVNRGLAYDFSNVYKFKNVSKRSDDVAYLDIWIDFLFREKNERFEKRKLVIEIHGHREADELMSALKHLNKILLDKKPPIEKF